MNKLSDELDYIHFLVMAQKVFSNTDSARSHLQVDQNSPAHDTYTRMLYRIQADGKAL